METNILIRYGELSTKGKNRKYFISKLESNVRKRFRGLKDYVIISKYDRMYIETTKSNEPIMKELLKTVFGIQTFSIVRKVNADYDTIEQEIMNEIDFSKYKTFKVITKRANKQFPLKSDEINRKIATKILQETDLKVLMKDYDLEVNIDIRKDKAYVYLEKIAGAKGFPVGISGQGLLMLSGGIDSPVAGYLVLKRGVAINCIHFASPPYTSQKALNKVISLAASYLDYIDEVIIYNVKFSEMQLAINKYCDANYSMTIMRRMMYRITQRLAVETGSDIIVNGESIAQVASQTLQSMKLINEVVDLPVIRPVGCLDKLEIIDIAKKIGTYETSILPYEDCCTIFLPPNPVIAPKKGRVLVNEDKFNYESLIDTIMDNIERIVVNAQTINSLLTMEEENIF